MTIEKYFGEAVRRYRGKRSLSQGELAKRAGLQRTYLSDIERGKRNVSLQTAAKVAKALRLPLRALMPNR